MCNYETQGTWRCSTCNSELRFMKRNADGYVFLDRCIPCESKKFIEGYKFAQKQYERLIEAGRSTQYILKFLTRVKEKLCL